MSLEDVAGPRRATPQPSISSPKTPLDRFLAWRAPPAVVFANFVIFGMLVAIVSFSMSRIAAGAIVSLVCYVVAFYFFLVATQRTVLRVKTEDEVVKENPRDFYYCASLSAITLALLAFICEHAVRSATGGGRNRASTYVSVSATGILGLGMLTLAQAKRPTKTLLWLSLAAHCCLALQILFMNLPTEKIRNQWRAMIFFNYESDYPKIYVEENGGYGKAPYPPVGLFSLHIIRTLALCLGSPLPAFVTLVMATKAIKVDLFSGQEKPSEISDEKSYVIAVAGGLMLALVTFGTLPSAIYLSIIMRLDSRALSGEDLIILGITGLLFLKSSTSSIRRIVLILLAVGVCARCLMTAGKYAQGNGEKWQKAVDGIDSCGQADNLTTIEALSRFVVDLDERPEGGGDLFCSVHRVLAHSDHLERLCVPTSRVCDGVIDLPFGRETFYDCHERFVTDKDFGPPDEVICPTSGHLAATVADVSLYLCALLALVMLGAGAFGFRNAAGFVNERVEAVRVAGVAGLWHKKEGGGFYEREQGLEEDF